LVRALPRRIPDAERTGETVCAKGAASRGSKHGRRWRLDFDEAVSGAVQTDLSQLPQDRWGGGRVPANLLPGWTGSMPVSVFYAKDGRQVAHFIGEKSREQYEEEIRALLADGGGAGSPGK